VAITDLGRSLLATLTRLSEWQSAHHSELLANDVDWRAVHDDGQT
jgi:DNA-binding HxlR family transcriptional regulator